MNPGAPTWDGKVLLDDKLADALAASGAGSVRINFRLEGTAWDTTSLATYDAIVDRVRKRGLEPLGLLAYEGVPGGQEQWNDDPDGDGFNAYVDRFAETAKQLFAHFEGRVRRWEIWNEPNCWSNPSYASDPTHAGCTYLLPRVFAKTLAETYVRNQTLVDGGDVTLVSGGLLAHDLGGTFSTATDYLDAVYSDGVWDWLEAHTKRRYAWGALGYHLYVGQGAVADAKQLGEFLDSVRAAASSRGDAAPFALTEFGWTTASVTPNEQAMSVTVATEAFAARADVSNAYWFSYADVPAADLAYGLVDPNGTPKPALGAYQAEANGCEAGASGSGGAGGSAASSGGAAANGGTPAAAGSTAGSGGAWGATESEPVRRGCGCTFVGERGDGALVVLGLALLARLRKGARG